MVPRERVGRCPTSLMAALSTGSLSATSADNSTARWRVIAPMQTTSPWSFDIGQIRNAIEVDDDRRRREPKVHHRNEALAAGQQTDIGAIRLQQRQRLVDRGRRMIVKARRLHRVLAEPILLSNPQTPFPRSATQAAFAGKCLRQCRAISVPRQNQTPLKPRMYSSSRISPVHRPGRPISRSCRPMERSLGEPFSPSR